MKSDAPDYSGIAAAGDAGVDVAFSEAWVRHRDELLGFARKQLPLHQAEDALSDTMESTLRAIRNGNGPTDNVRAYLFQALRHNIIRIRTAKHGDDEILDEATPMSVNPIEELAMQKNVACVLSRMDEGDAAVLRARLLEGRTLREIAEHEGVAPATMSSRLYQAKRRFKSDWLDASTSRPGIDANCRAQLALFGPVHAGTASAAEAEGFHAHLLGCEFCTEQVMDLETLSGVDD